MLLIITLSWSLLGIIITYLHFVGNTSFDTNKRVLAILMNVIRMKLGRKRDFASLCNSVLENTTRNETVTNFWVWLHSSNHLQTRRPHTSLGDRPVRWLHLLLYTNQCGECLSHHNSATAAPHHRRQLHASPSHHNSATFVPHLRRQLPPPHTTTRRRPRPTIGDSYMPPPHANKHSPPWFMYKSKWSPLIGRSPSDVLRPMQRVQNQNKKKTSLRLFIYVFKSKKSNTIDFF